MKQIISIILSLVMKGLPDTDREERHGKEPVRISLKEARPVYIYPRE